MIVVQETKGRLGNQLHRLAHIIGFASEEHLQVINISMGDEACDFLGLKYNLIGRYPVPMLHIAPATVVFRRRLSRFFETKTFKRLLRLALLPQCNYVASTYESRVYLAKNNDIRQKSSRGVVHLYGHYFYCHELVKKHADNIRQFFSLLPDIERPIIKFMKGYRRDNSLIIGVHIRKGDYKTYMNGDYYFDDAVYAEAMRRIQELWSPVDPLFLLCSDAPLSVTAFSNFRHITLGTTALADLYALSLCDAVIGPKSSFTAWSSFFGSVPRFVMKPGATQPKRREEFWICDDLRGGVTADDKVD